MSERYYRESFTRISPEKQEKILRTAILEFSSNGYESANINRIADAAGVSVGSLYKYFESKENLYLAVVHYGVETVKDVLGEVMNGGGDLLSKIARIIRAIQTHSRSDVHLTRLYSEMATESRSDLVGKIVVEMEGETAGLYASMIREARDGGLIRSDLDPGLGAFFLDNLFMSLQFSYSCEYYRERLLMYAGADVFDDDERVAEQLLAFIREAFGWKGAEA